MVLSQLIQLQISQAKRVLRLKQITQPNKSLIEKNPQINQEP